MKRVNPRVALFLVLACGAAVRLLLMRVSTGILSPDSDSFYRLAQAIVAGDWLTHDPFKTPLYSVFLAGFLAVAPTATSGAVAVGVQHLLGLIATAVFFAIANKLFGLWVAVVSSLLFTTHALLLFYETSVLSEVLFIVLLALVLHQSARVLTERAPAWRFAAVGVFAGLATLTRPVAEWFVVILVGQIVIGERASRRSLVAALTVGIAYTVTIAPWMFVNSRSYEFWGVGLGRGLGLFMRVFDVDKQPAMTGTAYPLVEQAIAATNHGNAYAVRNQLNFRLGLSASETDDQMLGYALATVRARPVSFIRNSATNWMTQLLIVQEDIEVCRAREGPYLCNSRSTDMSTAMFPNVPPAGNRQLKRRVTAWFTGGYVRMWVVVPLAFVGMGYDALRRASASDPRAKRAGILLMAAIVYFSGVPALINWPEERFRLPIDALLFMFACVGGQGVVGFLRNRFTVVP
ncbi:MAG: glycosyltransferase family 39 protein [Vicinamibacterales bacterium]